jgi:hypothetical protein
MFARIMKWVSLAALLASGALWSAGTNQALLLNVVVFMGAVVVLQQAVAERAYAWATGFGAIALVFNPAAPLLDVSTVWFPLMTAACGAIFATSLAFLKSSPVLSMASITGRTPGSESL